MHIASSSSVVKFYEWPSGQLLHAYKTQSKTEGPNKSISWGKDGTWLAIVPDNGSVEIISVKESIKRLYTIKDIPFPTCAAFQNNTKKNVAVADINGQVLIYDMKARGVKKTFESVSSSIFYLEFTAKDSHIAAACENGEVALFSNLTSALSCKLTIPNSPLITALRCHPTRRNFIIGGSREGVVAVWDVNSNKTKYCKKAHCAAISGVTFSPLNYTLIVTLGLDRQFSFFDIMSNVCVAQIPVDNNVTAVDFAPDGKSLGVASQDGRIFLYDTRFMNAPLKYFPAHDSQINQLLFQKISQEEVLDNISEEPSDITTSYKSASFESFGVCADVMPSASVEISHTSSNVREGVDSFMEAIGLSLNATSPSPDNSLSITESVKAFIPTLGESFARTDKKIVQESPNLKQMSSTPKYVLLNQQENRLNFSPIEISAKQANTPPTLENNNNNPVELQILIKNTIKEVVVEELKELKENIAHQHYEMKNTIKEVIDKELEIFKKDISHQHYEVISTTRSHLLDLQMYMVKQFIQTENDINRMKEELLGDDNNCVEALIDENCKLRTQLSLLQDKLNYT